MSSIKRTATKFFFGIVIFAIGAAFLGSILPSNPWLIPLILGFVAFLIWNKFSKKRGRRTSRTPVRKSPNSGTDTDGGSLESRK